MTRPPALKNMSSEKTSIYSTQRRQRSSDAINTATSRNQAKHVISAGSSPRQTKHFTRTKKRLRFDLLSVLHHRRRERYSGEDSQAMILSPATPSRSSFLSEHPAYDRPSSENVPKSSTISPASTSRVTTAEIVMSGALSSDTRTGEDFMFSSPGFGVSSGTESQVTTPRTSSSFSLIAYARSATRPGSETAHLSEHRPPLRSSASAIYESGKHTPLSVYRQSAMSLPLNMEWMATRSDNLPDLPIACIGTVSRPTRSYSAPGVGQSSTHTGQGVSTFPDPLLGSLLLYLDYGSYKAVRMTCRPHTTSLRSHLSKVQRLPTEIMQLIFRYLSPMDFNAARNTCESWFKMSLRSDLLIDQLQRGGWLRSAEQDLEDRQLAAGEEDMFTIEQIFSLRLTKECALTAGRSKDAPTDIISGKDQSLFVCTATVDFIALHTDLKRRDIPRLRFTISTCSQFLLVARDRLIFIYAFKGSLLIPLCNVVCPRRVMAMSMDASSKRNVVAALLDGRCGILADLSDSTKAFRSESHVGLDLLRKAALAEEGPLTPRLANAKTWDSCCPAAGSTTSTSNLLPLQEPEAMANMEPTVTGASVMDTLDLQSVPSNKTTWIHHKRVLDLSGHNSRRQSKTSPSTLIDRKTNPSTPRSEWKVPFVTAPKSVYRHLGSDFDPPRSVAICPSRRCVAFGCSGRIELHWVDAATEQEQYRWFPLAQPADFLYFLAPHESFDSAKKLRIISSAAIATERHSLRRLAQKAAGGFTSIWPTSHKAEAVLTSSPAHLLRTGSEERDHLRAVPLSDGYHILFTDPNTNLVCLGTDAPVNGPSKLARLIVFVPPASLASRATSQHAEAGGGGELPKPPQATAYAAAPDLSRGVRIVAAYADDIVFYSVPGDVFAQSFAVKPPPHFKPSSDHAQLSLLDRIAPDAHWLDWWPAPSTAWNIPNPRTEAFPLQIEGILVGSMRGEGVNDVAILTGQESTCVRGECRGGSDIVIWAFSRDGQRGTVWCLDGDDDDDEGDGSGGAEESEDDGEENVDKMKRAGKERRDMVEWEVSNDGGIRRVGSGS